MKPSNWWYVRGTYFCCAVGCIGETIIETAPILNKFKGHNINKLLTWKYIIPSERMKN